MLAHGFNFQTIWQVRPYLIFKLTYLKYTERWERESLFGGGIAAGKEQTFNSIGLASSFSRELYAFYALFLFIQRNYRQFDSYLVINYSLQIINKVVFLRGGKVIIFI